VLIRKRFFFTFPSDDRKGHSLNLYKGMFNLGIGKFDFYSLLLRRARLCHSKSSVLPSVRLWRWGTYDDHICWNNSKIISRPISGPHTSHYLVSSDGLTSSDLTFVLAASFLVVSSCPPLLAVIVHTTLDDLIFPCMSTSFLPLICMLWLIKWWTQIRY